MQATIDHIHHHSAAITTFWLRPERPLRYTAGEFVEVFLPHEQPDSRGDKRWFTLYSSPTEELLAITSKFPERAPSSFKRSLRSLTPGSTITIGDPMGEFLLPKNPRRPIVFVVRGIGVTPVRSITKWLTDSGEQRDIQLLYTSDPGTHIDSELFTAYYGERWQAHTGRVTAADIPRLPANQDALYYLAGSEAMIKTLAADIQVSGVAPYNIVTDYFPGYPA